MPPEYTAYLTSPHARIDCVECHIGRGFIATRVSRKAGDIRHIVSLAFEQYEFPIRADDLRPARDTCERCHFPEKFSDDSLREIQRFLPDEDNTAQTIYLVLKTGGGSARQGLGRGIHWHIENPVSYYASDPEKQQIPYVRVERPDGTLVEYVDVEFGIQPGQRRRGRPGGDGLHHLPQPHHPPGVPPRDSVDGLLARGEIDPAIPGVRRKAVEALEAEYASDEAAMAGIAALRDYYQEFFPDLEAANPAGLDDLVSVLQETYRQSVFREQKSDWNSHPNNIGHENSPGCFRCHDGKHLDAARPGDPPGVQPVPFDPGRRRAERLRLGDRDQPRPGTAVPPEPELDRPPPRRLRPDLQQLPHHRRPGRDQRDLVLLE